MSKVTLEAAWSSRQLPWRRRALLGLEKLLGSSGLADVFGRMKPCAGATLLMYHSVVTHVEEAWIDPANSLPLDVFKSQMEYLASRKCVISMNQLVDRLEAGAAPEPGTVVITFDDGYLDNRRWVAPLLRDLDLPATVYLATGYIEQGLSQWIDHLYTSFNRRTRDVLALDRGESFDLAIRDSLLLAHEACANTLIGMTMVERSSFLDCLDQQLQPVGSPPRLTMDWDDVRQLKEQFPGVEIGVHTRDHMDLEKHESMALEQIESSIQDVRREIGCTPSHFSFPYCRSTNDVQMMLRTTGLRSAVATSMGYLNSVDSDLFGLSRVEAPRSRALFRLFVSGAYPALPMLMTRRA